MFLKAVLKNTEVAYMDPQQDQLVVEENPKYLENEAELSELEEIIAENSVDGKPGLWGEEDQEDQEEPEQLPQQIQVQKKQELGEEVINRFLEYAKVCYGLEATAQVLQGESVDSDLVSELFKKQKDAVEQQLEQQKEQDEGITKKQQNKNFGKKIKLVEFSKADKVEDVWDLFKKLISKQMSAEKVFGQIKPGVPVSVAVNIHGKIFRVTFSGVKDTDDNSKCYSNVFDVQLQQYYFEGEDKKAVLKVGSNLLDKVRVKLSGDEVFAYKCGTKIQLSSGRYRDRIYQLNAFLSIIGKELSKTGEITDKIDPKTKLAVAVKYPQLLIAGTGTGKTGILATAAAAYGGALFVTKDKKLVQDMIKDVNSFIKTDGVVAGVLPDNFAGDINTYLKEHPYTVITHEQLLKYAGDLKQQNILIDEVHAVCPKSYSETFKDVASKLQNIMESNNVLGATGTPTNEIKQVFGGEGAIISNIPLHKIQNEERMVRRVQSNDIETTVEDKDKFYKDSAAAYLATNSPNNIQGTVDKASQQQGISFWDDPIKAARFCKVLNELDKDEQLQERLNTEALANEQDLTSKTEELPELPAEDKRNVYGEIRKAQYKNIGHTVMIDIILKLGWVKKQEKDLQELLLIGKSDEIEKMYERSIAQQNRFKNNKAGRLAYLGGDKFFGAGIKALKTFSDGKDGPTNYDILMEDKEFREIVAAYRKTARVIAASGEEKADATAMPKLKAAMNADPIDIADLRAKYNGVLTAKNSKEINHFRKTLNEGKFDQALKEYEKVVDTLPDKEAKIDAAKKTIDAIKQAGLENKQKPKSKKPVVSGKPQKKTEDYEENPIDKLVKMYSEGKHENTDAMVESTMDRFSGRIDTIKQPEKYKELKDGVILKRLRKIPEYTKLYNAYMGIVKKNCKQAEDVQAREKNFTDIARVIAESGNVDDAGIADRLKLLRDDFIKQLGEDERYNLDWSYKDYKDVIEKDERVKLYFTTLEKYFDVSTKILDLEQQAQGKIDKGKQEPKKTAKEIEARQEKLKKLYQEKDDLIVALDKKSSIATLLLTDPNKDKNNENTKITATLLEKGMTRYIVSTGNLGTGYSNIKLLRLSAVISKSLKDFDEDEANNPITTLKQQFGRNLRGKGDKGEMAITTVMIDKLIPPKERNFTAEDLSGPRADEIYGELMSRFDTFQLEKRKQAKEIHGSLLKELQEVAGVLPDSMSILKKSVNSLALKISEDIADKNIAQKTPHEVESYQSRVTSSIKQLHEIGGLYKSLDALRRSEMPLDDLTSKRVNKIEKLFIELELSDPELFGKKIEEIKKKINFVVSSDLEKARDLIEKLNRLEGAINAMQQLPGALTALRASAAKLLKVAHDKLDNDEYIIIDADIDVVGGAIENLGKIQKLSEDKFSQTLKEYSAAVANVTDFLQKKSLSVFTDPEKALEQLEELHKNMTNFKFALDQNLVDLREQLEHFSAAKDELGKAIYTHLTALTGNEEKQVVAVEELERTLVGKIAFFQPIKATVNRLGELKQDIDKIPDAAEFGLKTVANERLNAADKLLKELEGQSKKQYISDTLKVINTELAKIEELVVSAKQEAAKSVEVQKAEEEQIELAKEIEDRKTAEESQNTIINNKKAADIVELQDYIDKLLGKLEAVPKEENLYRAAEKTLKGAIASFEGLKSKYLENDAWDSEIKKIKEQLDLVKAIEESKNGQALAKAITQLREVIKLGSAEPLLLAVWTKKLQSLMLYGSIIAEETAKEAEAVSSKLSNYYKICEYTEGSKLIEVTMDKAKDGILDIQSGRQKDVSKGLADLSNLVNSIGEQLQGMVSRLNYKLLLDRQQSLIDFKSTLQDVSVDQLIGNAIGFGLLTNKEVEELDGWKEYILFAQTGENKPNFLEPLKRLLKIKIDPAIDDTVEKIRKTKDMAGDVGILKQTVASMKESNKKELAEKLKKAAGLLDVLKKANEDYRSSRLFNAVNLIPLIGSGLSNYFWGKSKRSIEQEEAEIQKKKEVVKELVAIDLDTLKSDALVTQKLEQIGVFKSYEQIPANQPVNIGKILKEIDASQKEPGEKIKLPDDLKTATNESKQEEQRIPGSHLEDNNGQEQNQPPGCLGKH
jgi:hypothetical protein